MMKRFSKPWKVLLFVVPMLICSLTGQATEYTIEFGAPSNGQIKNANGATMWTYATNGTVSNLTYSENSGLSFSIPVGGDAENSLTLTSSQRFSGTLKSVDVVCNKITGLIIEVLVGQKKLGELTDNDYNDKTKSYGLSLSYGVMSDNISLKFKVASGANVSGLKVVMVYIDDSVYPIFYDTSVTFNYEDLKNAVLSNYSYKGILFTLNESGGDGIENEDGGAIYMGTPFTDAAVENLHNRVKNHNYHPGDPGYAIDFSGGITMMVARGKGFFELEALTESNYAYHVKIGDADPVEFVYTNRQKLSVPYNVSKDTYLYIYLVDKSPSSSRSGTRIGKRGTAHGIVFSLRCASAPVEVSDISVYVDYIMGRDTFIFHNADINNDEKIDVVDIVKILKSK